MTDHTIYNSGTGRIRQAVSVRRPSDLSLYLEAGEAFIDGEFDNRTHYIDVSAPSGPTAALRPPLGISITSPQPSPGTIDLTPSGHDVDPAATVVVKDDLGGRTAIPDFATDPIDIPDPGVYSIVIDAFPALPFSQDVEIT